MDADDAEEGRAAEHADLDVWRASQDILQALPPLPTPDWKTLRLQNALGVSGVIGAVVVALVSTHIGTRMADSVRWGVLPQVLLVLVHVEAVLALGCLAGIMCTDPGVVQRSSGTCLPVPLEVAMQIRNSEPLSALSNIKEEDGRIYCTRCLIWREKRDKRGSLSVVEQLCGSESKGRFHHCSVCQRCVQNFDHHCGFFGRCIAGSGFGGNMGYFKSILAVGFLGYANVGVAVVIGLSRYNIGRWVAMGIGIYCACVCLLWLVMCVVRMFTCMLRAVTGWSERTKWTQLSQRDAPAATIGAQTHASAAE